MSERKFVRHPKAPLPLFTQRADGVRQEKCFACGECGHVFASDDSAQRCCQQNYCTDCQKEAPQCWTICSSCLDLKKFSKSVEIAPEDHDGPVYDDSRDKFFTDLDEALSWYDDGDEAPEWLFPCRERPCPPLDLDSAIENMCSDLYEDAYEHLNGLPELEAAVKIFNDAQTLKTWETDYRRKISVKKAMAQG